MRKGTATNRLWAGQLLASLICLFPTCAIAQFQHPSLCLRDISNPCVIGYSGVSELTNPHPFQWVDNTIASPNLAFPYRLSYLERDTQFRKPHSPKKATIMAIALPGSGQIYNQKYWKVPLVYAGLGASVWAIGHFRGEMRALNDSISGIFGAGKTPSAQLIAERDRQRSRRDIAILCLAGVYIFQVIDATVDAHFFKFNINENIGLRVCPSPARTLALQYKF
jgi:hypothetical protein